MDSLEQTTLGTEDNGNYCGGNCACSCNTSNANDQRVAKFYSESNPANDYKPKFGTQNIQRREGFAECRTDKHDPSKAECLATTSGVRASGHSQCCFTLSNNIANIPLKAFHQSTLELITSVLDLDTESRNADYVRQNWEGLAEYMNLDPEVIEYIASYRANKTLNILKVWNKTGARTIGELWNLIGKLGRFDILYCRYTSSRIRSDARRYFQLQQNQRCQRHNYLFEDEDITGSNILIDPDDAVKLRRDKNVDEYEVVVVQDVYQKKDEERAMFHAYVSFSEKDLPFVREVIKFLEEDNNLKLCLKERDLLPGSSTYYSVANIIATRCSKMIVVMSPEYQKSIECDYQSKIALAMNCPQIVVLYKECELPPAMKIMSLLRYSDLPAAWFWSRICLTITDSHSCLSETEQKSSSRTTNELSTKMNVWGHRVSKSF